MASATATIQTAVSTPTSPLHSPLSATKVAALSPSAAAAAAAAGPSPLEAFKSDPIFSPFLSSDFNPAAFSASALSAGSAASSSEHLQNAIRLLHQHLRSQILHRHHHLLRQLSSISDCNSSLTLIRSSVCSLQSSLARLRSDVSAPFRLIRLQTLQLSNLHTTIELLQSTVRLLRQTQKLRSLMQTPDFDVSKAAQLYNDIQMLRREGDLTGIAVVDDELGFLTEAATGLRSEGMKVLERGMDGLNQAEVGSGLQVFYNMGELKTTVEAILSKYRNMGIKSIGAALDMKAISGSGGGGSGGRGFGPGAVQRSGLPQIGGGGRAREGLWLRMGNCMDQLHSVVVAVWHLQRVLSKKRDPFTHILFLDEILKEDEPTLTDRVWEALVKSFASQMKSAFTTSSFVKEIFTTGYPKLYSMIENLLERISRDTGVKGVPPAVGSDGKDQMIAAIEPFQSAFLAQCLSRLSDLVDNVFPVSARGNIPSKDQISKIISRIQEEIEAVKLDGHLTLLVLREIGKVLLLLAQRAEYQISTGPEPRQVTGPATPSQLKNFMLCQHLQEVHSRVTSIVLGLPAVAAEVLSASLGAIYGVACDSLTSLFQAMVERLESCILQIHDQNFGDQGTDSADNATSSYMDELQKAIVHFRTEFLSRLLPSSMSNATGTTAETICSRLVRRMASRVLVFFVRHASLVRPLSEIGKLRMAKDMAELELVVEQNLFPVEQLGAPYRALRALRPVIFLETSQLFTSPLLQDLPPSVILHHLYSRGPDDLLSPMQRNNLTPSKYSLWLDSQGEDQIWKGIKTTLDDYAANVRSRGEKEFSPVYAIMLQIGSSLSGAAPPSHET
ncbi:unnamed protein product [Victoria cruziana]